MKLRTLACMAATLPCLGAVHAQTAPQTQPAAPQTQPATTNGPVTSMDAIRVEASADASAGGLAAPFAGGQVARGGRVGILGTEDFMSTPFSVTSYTNELIQDRQAKSVGDVLQNDATVRVARGFGNFQESYFIRGFILSSDDVAYNGLFSLLPRQYIATELFERVEVLRGASAFLTGAPPSGGGIGGVINLVPKRAPNEPLTRVTTGVSSGGQFLASTDIARRFGPDDSTGIRFNAAQRSGDTGVDDEHSRTSVVSLGLDWRSADTRLSGDIGWQENKLKRARPNVTLAKDVTVVPDAPDASSNFAQPWSYSNERDVFGTLRAEHDFSDKLTGWAAYGFRRSDESNSLGNVTVTNGSTGAAQFSRFDNVREDRVDTGEFGLRANLKTGSVGHQFVASASFFQLKKDNAYATGGTRQTNIYDPVSYYDAPPLTRVVGDMDNPSLTGRIKTSSFAFGDTMSFLEDRVLLTAGIRHQRLSSRSYDYDTSKETGSYDASHNSPAAGLVVKVSPNVSLYANYIEALVAGDTAPATVSTSSGFLDVVNAGQILPPYVSKQKEIGVKYEGEYFGSTLALFTTDKPRAYTDLSDLTFKEAGKDRHQGVELNVFGEVSRSVRLLGGFTWLDAEQRSTGDSAIDGNRVIGVPRFQTTMGAEWDIPGVQGLTVDGRVVYTGSSYANAQNTLKVPGWTRFDAGVRYMTDVGGHALTLRARVENIANRNYWASVGGYPGSGYLVLGGPRTFSLSASMDF